MSTPDFLPILSAGAHKSPKDGACMMEMASLLAGESWSDSPSCTHPVIATMARSVNDRLPDSRRHEIATLIPSVIGTADLREDETERRVLSVRLAVWCAKQVAHLSPDPKVAWAAIEAAETWCEHPCEETASAAADAASAAYAAYAASAALPGLLRGLIAEHARLTGHQPSPAVQQVWESTDFAALIH